MDIISTSLEALIQRATCSQNQCLDTAAIDAFCGLINKEPDSVQTAIRFITAKVHSLQEWEALQALNVLDACMKRCGSNFHAEVGKFRFLNELIKLVSPKYNGAHTPEPVKRRVLELMQSWTVYYPKEFKIKEAYEMLKKQGVVKEEPLRLGSQTEAYKTPDHHAIPSVPQLPLPSHHQESVFQDTEKNRLLQKLLQSKNPDDLQAANRLIKTMVKENERRVEMKSRHLSELEAAHNNARLLSEMLDSYSSSDGNAASSDQDLELIKELQASCLRFRPNLQRLLNQINPQDNRLFNEVLMANDELGEVLEKYNVVVVQGLPVSAVFSTVGENLLDLSTPTERRLPVDSLLNEQFSSISIDSALPGESELPSQLLPTATLLPPLAHPSSETPSQHQPSSDLASLGEIFSSLTQQPLLLNQPATATLSTSGLERKTGLEELDQISASLLKQSLPSSKPQQQIKALTKVSMNQLSLSQTSPLHSNSLSSNPTINNLNQSSSQFQATENSITAAVPISTRTEPVDFLLGPITMENTKVLNGDDQMVDITNDPLVELGPNPKVKEKETKKDMLSEDVHVKTDSQIDTLQEKNEVVKPLPLGDITLPLDSIKPGSLPPLTLLEERGICVTIHFGKDRPRPDVSVFVVTTTSKSQFPISDYLFQAIVPKECRLRLQPPSSTELPAHNPFLPPAAITQVMLIASATKDPILLRVVLSFTMDDETVTEMKEVERFSVMNS